MDDRCAECGHGFGDNWLDCCCMYVCDDCLERHNDKYGIDEEETDGK